MNDWTIQNVVNDIYKLQQSLSGLRSELENELKANAEARKVAEYARSIIVEERKQP